jgi:hypothetical protein
MGIWVTCLSRATSSRMPGSVVPAASARSEDSWMVGPSAIGSENGTPSSMRSHPARSSSSTTFSVVARSGSPAVTKVTSAFSPRACNSANFFSILLIIRSFRPGSR